MNSIILIGNLTRDPETRATASGVTVCSFTIAVNRRFASQGGEKITDYFRINAWRSLGDNCATYLAKGRKVAVTGELQARLYDATDGSKRVSLDVNADEVEFLTPNGYAKPDDQVPFDPNDLSGFKDIATDDIPF